MRDRVARIQETLRKLGADWAVLNGPDTVCYATDHVVPIEAGPSPFAGGPTTALVSRDGVVALIGPAEEVGAAPGPDVVRGYAGYTWADPADAVRNFHAAVVEVARTLRLSGTLAVEGAGFTAGLAAALDRPSTLIDEVLRRARAIKTPEELSRLQRAAEVAALGQGEARRRSAAARSELEIFGDVRVAMERAAGRRCPVTGDFLSGIARTAAAAGWPIERVLGAGDPVICDLAPRVDGYWGDSCGSFCVGVPSDGYRRMFDAARAALDAAAAEIRPGVPIARLDAALRATVRQQGFAYPHHSGHSIGTSVHEYPRIVPYETANIEENMVLMVEPGAYDPRWGGVRLEFMFQVTAKGARAMSTFPLGPDLLAQDH